MDLMQQVKDHNVKDEVNKAFNLANTMSQINTSSMDQAFKAMATSTSGAGADFIPTGFSPEVINIVRLALKVPAIFQHVNMPMNPYVFPVEGGDPTTFIIPENTGDTSQTSVTGSNAGTAKVTFTAKTIGSMVRVSVEEEQDSIVPAIPFIQKKLLLGLGYALENALLNGDTTATHQDSDVTSSGDVRKVWKGLRYYALNSGLGTKVDLSTFTTANLRAVRATMGKYGVNADDLVWIVSASMYMKMLGLSEVTTVQNYGPEATIVTGELAKFDGIPVVVATNQRADLNASGVFDNTTKTKTSGILVNRNAFMLGDRQAIELTQGIEPIEYRQRKLMATQRIDFQPVYNMTTEPVVAIAYNV